MTLSNRTRTLRFEFPAIDTESSAVVSKTNKQQKQEANFAEKNTEEK